MQTAPRPIRIVKGEGSYLYSADGRCFLDGISSWCANIHGHAHPYIVEKLQRQAEVLEHVIFADFTHPCAEELATRLLSILPSDLSKVFFSDNGATTVEAALKMTIQYWYNQNPQTAKTKVVCFKNGYHGDTFGAMSAGGKTPYNRPFQRHLFQVEAIDPPFAGREQSSVDQLRSILEKEETACFIFEPLILGFGGMMIYPPQGLDRLIKMCRDHGVLTIADEVMTGFGRTGSLFACEQLIEEVDIICLSKGLTGGFLPLGVTACKQHLFDAFLSDHLHDAFLHGHTYTGNPLSCSCALANLDLLELESSEKQRALIACSHKQFCEKWKGHPKLRRCESLGTILVLEYESGGTTTYFHSHRNKHYYFFLERGILLRPLGNVLYVMPPYCITSDELQFIYDHIVLTLEGAV